MEAAFFYKGATAGQKPRNRAKPPSIHANANANANSSADSSLNPFSKRSRSKDSSKPPTHQKRPITTPTDSHLSSSAATTPSLQSTSSLSILTDPDNLSMLSTPLPDYKHTANQTSKSQAAQSHAATARKSSSTSGTSNDRKNVIQALESSKATSKTTVDTFPRLSNTSSTTGSSALTTVTTSDPPPSDYKHTLQPFTYRNGRRYLRDSSLPYPLPCDLTEIHRQTLRTMLLCQVFNGPICSPAFQTKPPKRVLEVGCGTGFWSIMCHRHFAQRGDYSISFTGLDITPIAPKMDSDPDMNWRFVQHDLRKLPLPFRDDEFGLIMNKDMSLATPQGSHQQALIDEFIRILKPGGTLEIWDGDHSLRMLLPYVEPTTNGAEGENSEDEDQIYTKAIGVYTITPQTPFSEPQNQYLKDYNSWISKALELRGLTPMPCTNTRPALLQEAEVLTDIDSRRLAIPLGEVRWEKEGISGVASQVDTQMTARASKGKGKDEGKRILTTGQAALRRTALMTVVQMIESLEPLLREASGKGQDEWDRWYGNMMNDLLKQGGISWGDCLEVGAWWARKRKS